VSLTPVPPSMFSSWNLPQVVPIESSANTPHTLITRIRLTIRQVTSPNSILPINPTPDTSGLRIWTSREDLIELIRHELGIPASRLGWVGHDRTDLEASGAELRDAVALSVAWLADLAFGVGFEGDSRNPALDLLPIWTWNAWDAAHFSSGVLTGNLDESVSLRMGRRG
jgi:hypothetical protein